MDSIKSIRYHLIALAFYSLLCLLFFHELIFQTRWFGEDFFSQNFPNRVFAADEIRRGHFPLWNPYVFSGMPFFADIQTAVLYPLNLLLSFFQLKDVNGIALLEYQVIFHLILGGWFVFIFLKELRLSLISALLGGTIFSFSGYLANQAHHTNMIYSGIWIPLVFFCCLRGIRDSSLWLWGCPAVLTLSLLGGHPQITLLIFYAFTAYYCFLSCTEKIPWKLSFARFILILSGFVLLSLVQIFPTGELLQYSGRSSLGFSESAKDSLPFYVLWNLFFPKLFVGTYQPWQLWEFRDYSGLGTMALALLGAATRKVPTKFFLVLALLALLLSLGENTPLYKLAYVSLPGLNFVRVPARFLFLYIFSLSVLAAYGLSALNSSKKSRAFLPQLLAISMFFLFVPLLSLWIGNRSLNYFQPHLISYFTLLSLLILIFFLVFRRPQSWTSWILILHIVADLYLFRGSFNQMNLTREGMIRSLESNPVALVAQILPKGARFQVRDANPLYANFGLIHRVSNTYGYNPFSLVDYFRINPYSPEGAYLLGTRLIDSADLEEYIAHWKNQKHFQVYNGFMVNPNVLPRVFFLTEARTDPNINIWARLVDKTFDPLKTVYLDREFPDFIQKTNKTLKYKILNWKYAPNKIELNLQSNGPGFLILTDVYYPGWHAKVNKEKKEVLKANSLLRAVPVKQFPAHVIFEFRPWSFIIGAIVSSGIALAGSAFFIGYYFKMRRTLES